MGSPSVEVIPTRVTHRAARARVRGERERSFPARVTVPAGLGVNLDLGEHHVLRRFRPHSRPRHLSAPRAGCHREHDTDLKQQLRRAATSIGLNLVEGAERRGGDRRRLFTYAHGSAAEVLGGLRLAVTFGYVTAEQAAAAVELAGRVKAMAYRLAQ